MKVLRNKYVSTYLHLSFLLRFLRNDFENFKNLKSFSQIFLKNSKNLSITFYNIYPFSSDPRNSIPIRRRSVWSYWAWWVLGKNLDFLFWILFNLFSSDFFWLRNVNHSISKKNFHSVKFEGFQMFGCEFGKWFLF